MYTEQNFWLVISVLFNHNYFKNNTPIFSMVNKLMRPKNHMGLVATKPVFGGLQTTKVQTSLRMRAVWSVSAFVIRFTESTLCKLPTGEISIF